MNTAKGFSIRIFIPSGEPEGLRIVEESNWTGQGLVFPRSLLQEITHRPELKRTGVYVLWGPDENSQLPRRVCWRGRFRPASAGAARVQEGLLDPRGSVH